MRNLIPVICLLGGVALLMPHDVEAAASILPTSYAGNATASAQTVSAIMGLAGSKGNAGCRICNPSATHVCVGGSNVDTTETNGGHCFPICNAASCAEQCVSLAASTGDISIKAGGTQVIFMFCGGWK